MTGTGLREPSVVQRNWSRRGRVLLLAGGGLGLLVGVWTGLARTGVHDAVGPVGAHGIIMTLGFIGTLIALERAVALGGRWPFVAPALAAAAVVWLTAGLPTWGAGGLLTGAGLVVAAAYAVLLARHTTLHMVVMATGAAAWVSAAGLWTVGWSPVRLAPTLAAFLVLTIVGERIELSRLREPSRASRRWLIGAVAVFAGGIVITLTDRSAGLMVAGVGLIAQTVWLACNDIARVTIRRSGLPRFAAACLLAGYVWLAAAGALWIALGLGLPGLLLHDAALHAVFLGFVMSMVMGHAPIILPAVTGTPLSYHWSMWVPLALLHASVAVRVTADLAASTWLRGWAAYGNVTALLLFAAVVVWNARRGTLSAVSPGSYLIRPMRPTQVATPDREQRSDGSVEARGEESS